MLGTRASPSRRSFPNSTLNLALKFACFRCKAERYTTRILTRIGGSLPARKVSRTNRFTRLRCTADFSSLFGTEIIKPAFTVTFAPSAIPNRRSKCDPRSLIPELSKRATPDESGALAAVGEAEFMHYFASILPQFPASLNSDSCAPFGTTSIYHCPTTGSLHSDAKTVRFFPAGNGWLICTFHYLFQTI